MSFFNDRLIGDKKIRWLETDNSKFLSYSFLDIQSKFTNLKVIM